MLSKTFTNSIKDGNDGSKFILDNRMLYHSLTNPLFKSKSLNLNDENDYPRAIGDIHKFSSPFESKWIFSPKLTKLVDEGKSPIGEFQSIFHALKINQLDEHQESAIELPPDSVFPAPSNLDLERYNKLGDDSIDSLADLGKDQFDEIVKGSTDILNDIGDNTIFNSLKEKSSFNEVLPMNASYVGYNLQEVKTPQGEVQGVMQIFDKNGLAQKIHYDDKGVISKTASNTTSLQNAKTKVTPSLKKDDKNPLHNVIKTAVNQLKQNSNVSKPNSPRTFTKINSSQNVSTKKPVIPEVKKITVKIEGHNFSNSSTPQQNHNLYPINELKSPENILTDFLQQLNGVTDVSDNANVRTDVHNSFHETVSENSYSYT